MINRPCMKRMLAAIAFAWAATTGPAITYAGNASNKPPTPSIDDLNRAAEKAAASDDYWTMLQAYRRLAEKGDARAQYKVGVMVQDDNLKEAVKWLRLAAEQGYAAAQFRLGVMYEDGRGVPQDKKEAAKWYQLAAAQGYEEAEYTLGTKVRPAPPVNVAPVPPTETRHGKAD
jgi:hypothetical protein